MITLYGMTSPNVVKILIALEEMALAYHVNPIDVAAGEQFQPGFLSLNPNAKVPVIVDAEGPDGRPYTVFESGAILLYLAEKTGQLLPTEAVSRYDVLQWLMVQLSGVGPMFGQFVHFRRFAPTGNDYSVSRYRTQVLRLCEVLDERLAQARYLGGQDYSIADVATFPWCRSIQILLGEAVDAYPDMLRWADVVAARPAVAHALSVVEDLRGKLTPFDRAAPETLDRIFGRGHFAK
jgi:GSH-dependent disulfide-bond oxidoreductase